MISSGKTSIEMQREHSVCYWGGFCIDENGLHYDSWCIWVVLFVVGLKLSAKLIKSISFELSTETTHSWSRVQFEFGKIKFRSTFTIIIIMRLL